MRDQEIIGLYEAYQQVCESSSITSEEVQSLDESDLQQKVGKALDAAAKNPVVQAIGKVIGPVNKGRRTPTATSGGYRPEEVEIDLFDTILEHLVAEGYADTNEAALVIMANMSEEWRQSIMEKEDSEYEKASDAALDARYGYGRAKGDKRSFGRAANRASAAAALRAIRRGERSGSGTSREAGSDAVHQGWARTARTSTDQTPEKKEKRKKLADTPYSNLPDDEKEKDRVSFDAVRATYNRNRNKG
jgi:hypothetical protein